MITTEAKTAIKAMFTTFKERADSFYIDMIGLVEGEKPLSQENIKVLEKTLSEIERNVNETRSILARLREVEKHIRCLDDYAKPENAREADND